MKASKESSDPNAIAESLNIGILQDTIKTLEETKLKLLITIKELKEKLEQQKADQNDIYFYLNKKCDESFEIIASLEEQLTNEQSDREIAEKLYENKIDELKSQNSQSESKFLNKIKELENKLEVFSNYSQSKQEMEKTMNDLMNTLEEERKQYQINMENMENKFLVERDKLRKTYDLKYESVKKDLESSIDGKLSKKTQRTQIMNVVMRKELDTQSRHADRLLEINEQLVDKDKRLKTDLDLANSITEELTKRLANNDRQIKKLKDDYSILENELNRKKEEYELLLNSKDQESNELMKKYNQAVKSTDAHNSKLDEMWNFLGEAYRRYQLSQGIKQKKSIKDSLQVDDHEIVLRELVKQIAMKYPQEVDQYLQAGDQLEKKTKTGILSWDDEERSRGSARGKPRPILRHFAVQTEEWNPSYITAGNLWNSPTKQSTSPMGARSGAHWSVLDSSSLAGQSLAEQSVTSTLGFSSIENSIAGIHSLPTVIHQTTGKKLIAPISDSQSLNNSIASVISAENSLDVPSIKSLNYILPNKPLQSRNEFVAKQRKLKLANRSDFENPETIFSTPPNNNNNEPGKIKFKYNFNKFNFDKFNQQSLTLNPNRDLSNDGESRIFLGPLASQDSDYFGMKISGTKFSRPKTLPKL